MNNPIGPYPGRQLFAGLTTKGNPCLAYLVTGRSPESRERKAVQVGNKVAIGPLGSVAYDPLRHYTAVQYDDATGVAAVTNGIQTEAVFETYRLLCNVSSSPTQGYLEGLLEGAGAEPDSLHTPRIAGIVTAYQGQTVCFIGIKRHDMPARVFSIAPAKGVLAGVSTYKGGLDNPEPFDPGQGLPTLKVDGTTAGEVARYLFDISAATYKGLDIRVCTIGVVFSGKAWSLATVNAR